MLSIEEAFGLLLAKAGKTVKLSLPFPEEPIVTHYAPQLKELARKKVSVKILTREIDSMLQSGDPKYLALAKALVRMADIYKSWGSEKLIEVRDFHRTIGTKGPSYHYESVHAKILVVDSTNAYVGSGEFRINSLYNNFELGVMISGPAAKSVENAYDTVWEHAVPFSIEQVQESLGRAVSRIKPKPRASAAPR